MIKTTRRLSEALESAHLRATLRGMAVNVVVVTMKAGGKWFLSTELSMSDVTKNFVRDSTSIVGDVERIHRTCVVVPNPVEKYLIHEATGSVYHRAGENICAHAMSSDGTFSPDCTSDACLIESAGIDGEIELAALLTRTFGEWTPA